MTELLLAEDERTLLTCERLWLGFSGGLDSCALLHILMQKPRLLKKLQVVHVNHGISPNADAWESKARLLCEQFNIPFVSKKVSLSHQSNIEEEARKRRYDVFRSLLCAGDGLLLAHHKDDQAETLLLQLFRGAGITGLAAMSPFKKFGTATIHRPLLHCSRKTLENYVALNGLSHVVDESNEDLSYSRNFLRHQVLPALQTRWPGVPKNLARTASHCLEAESLLQDLAEIDYPGLLTATEPKPTITITKLVLLSPARAKNVLQKWLRSHGIPLPSSAVFERLISEVIPAAKDRCPEIIWGKYSIKRFQHNLFLLKDFEEITYQELDWPNFPEKIPLPGNLGCLTITLEEARPMLSKGSVRIAFRKGGEEIILNGHRKSLKKLMQQWQIPPWQRTHIPLVYINSELAGVVGYAISDPFKPWLKMLTLCPPGSL